ncbi:hypothetical protein [Anseongella ginsenosidimutans]|uniref:hypothetical protein n=1 Tax=Anseongella ginsenosidimutans TaxID=496056 RepID=UPI001404A6EF|nr:hypothetical protein [Anseongella ginsenosidimutans]
MYRRNNTDHNACFLFKPRCVSKIRIVSRNNDFRARQISIGRGASAAITTPGRRNAVAELSQARAAQRARTKHGWANRDSAMDKARAQAPACPKRAMLILVAMPQGSPEREQTGRGGAGGGPGLSAGGGPSAFRLKLIALQN